MLEEIKAQAETAIKELIQAANLGKGSILVIGCSSSEIGGNKIGSNSSMELAEAVFNGIYPVVNEHGIYLATQCCEHLNRAIIIERELAEKIGAEIVNVVPQPKAGGSFSTKAYASFKNPVAIEKIKADAGIDIGGTLIGMHLKAVAVPVRLSINKIGCANIICARTRPKFIGGVRANYNQDLL
ncbi:MAG: TIGR01440 family protein [Oscillospiraceae bacterium]